MPKRRRGNGSVIRRRTRKRQKKRYARIPRGLFAKTTKQLFRYVDTVGLNPGLTNTVAYHTFSANGMYDPDITGVGHQPRGFDEYMQFYNHYTVIASKIRLTFATVSATTTGYAYVGVMATAAATPEITDINTIMENKATNSKVNSVMGTRPRIVSKGLSISKYFGQKVLQEDANAGTNAANPTEQVYWQIFAATNNSGTTDPDWIRVKVEIDYIAILHEPKLIAGS